ncbi:MAG: hypothetical protein AAGF93_00415 [Cyanobacteria bacterium P01_H01_bin.105]
MLLLIFVDNQTDKEVGVRRWPVCPQVNTHITYDDVPWCVKGVVHGCWVEDPEDPYAVISEVTLYVEPAA